MKNELSVRILRSSDCRELASLLWNQGYAVCTIDFIDPDGVVPVDTKIDDLFDDYIAYSNSGVSEFVHTLKKDEIITVTILPGEKNSGVGGFSPQVQCSLINKTDYFDRIIEFSNILVDEPYGIEKQVGIVKEIARTKFGKLENDELKLKWDDFDRQESGHIQILRSLQKLKLDEYIDFAVSYVNFNIVQYVEEARTWVPRTFGLMGIECSITLKQKMLAEWARLVDGMEDPIQYDEETGYLVLDSKNKKYKFSEGKNINSKFFKKLVDNINQVVVYPELAMIAWSKDLNEIEKLYELKGMKFVNKKVTRFAIDCRKKIMDLKLNNILTIESDQGYRLTYKESGLNVPKLAQAIAEMNSPNVEDIPF